MKNFSNTYIFTFSAIMVVVVAALLSIIALQLQPLQDKNERLEKMKSILSSVNVESTAKDAESLFEKYISESYVIDIQGNKQDSYNAFDVDLKKEMDKMNKIAQLKEKTVEKQPSPFGKFLAQFQDDKNVDLSKIKNQIKGLESERLLPVYEYKKDSAAYYILPMRGKGLWGPIWGYVSLEQDMNTIYGAMFDHKTETPGLGAEIADKPFQDQFKGKKILDEANKFVSVEVVKGGADETNVHAVDAISGGTITSKALEKMCYDFLSDYQLFFESKLN